MHTEKHEDTGAHGRTRSHIERPPPPPPRFLRNALYWAVLASLVASLALPAVAVTHSAPSDIPGTVLFSGSLRVGENSAFSDVQAGFDLITGRGSLSPASFTVDDATFGFSVIDVFSSNFAAYDPFLQVRFRAETGSDAALAGSLLALHLGPETFTFRFDDRDSAGTIELPEPRPQLGRRRHGRRPPRPALRARSPRRPDRHRPGPGHD